MLRIKIKWAPSLGKLTSCSSLSGNFCKIIRIHLSICTHRCVKLFDPLYQWHGKKCSVHGKHIINDASVKPCIMLARFLRKFTYLVCVQWNEFLTGQDIVIHKIVQFLNTQECTLLASSYIFYFNVLFCLSVYKKYAITDRHFWLNMHGLMQLFILKIIDLFLVRNFSDKFHNIHQKPDEIKWKSNPFSKKLWQK